MLCTLACAEANPDPTIDAGPGDLGGPDGAAQLDGAAHPDGGPTDRGPSDGHSGLADDRTVYLADDLNVRVVELTVADQDGLAAVEDNQPGASVPAIFREGDFGVGATAPNAVLELRGASTRFTDQKSYKLKLDDPAHPWRGQRVINLNKHPYDLTRARNALAFTLFREVEHLSSLRISLVHLVINGESRGLFTQIEQPNRLFLANHGFDPGGWLYKANNFTFYPVAASIWADPAALDEVLEPKGRSDHGPIQEMIAAVNDEATDIDRVIDVHFDRENYETWLATNLLFGNWDTISQNFYLYRRSDGGPWYFLPWDYDGALGFDEQPGNPPRPRWQAGWACWWEVPLHRRFLEKPENHARLERRLQALATQLEPRVGPTLQALVAVIRPFVGQEPDVEWLPVVPPADQIADRLAQFDAEVSRLEGQLGRNLAEARAVVERPMPVWLGEPIAEGTAWRLDWDPSYDLQGDPLRYEFRLGTTPDLSSPLVQRRDLEAPHLLLPELGAGTYYWTVDVRDTKDPVNHWQQPFDRLELNGAVYDGVRTFTLP